jgi:hypothetical protein
MLMDRIDCTSLLDMSYPKQLEFIEKTRTIRSSALNAAKMSSKKLTKSAKKNLAKGTGRKRKPKDLTKAANDALAKLTPEQIALITKQFQ